MGSAPSIKDLYLRVSESLFSPKDPFFQGVMGFLETGDVPPFFWDTVFTLTYDSELNDPLELYRKLSVVNLLAKLTETKTQYQLFTANTVLGIGRPNASPLEDVYYRLNAHLSGLTALGRPSAYGPEWSGRWDRDDLPRGLQLAELGLVQAVIGRMTQQEVYLEAAERIARWLLQTLDSRGFPLPALFLNEEEGGARTHALAYGLLFDVVSALTNQVGFSQELAVIAETLWSWLGEQSLEPIASWPLAGLAMWVWVHGRRKCSRSFGAPAALQLSLPALIEDPKAGLVGLRSQDLSVALTMTGYGSGLGCMLRNGFGIANFGPSLKEGCFGLRSGSHALSQRLRTLEARPESGTVCVAGRVPLFPDGSSFIETSLSFQNAQLHIESVILPLGSDSDASLQFYVKADAFQVGRGSGWGRKGDVHQGKADEVRLLGAEGALMVLSFDMASTVKVRSLPGGERFWGADFAVSFLMPPAKSVRSDLRFVL